MTKKTARMHLPSKTATSPNGCQGTSWTENRLNACNDAHHDKKQFTGDV